MGWLQDESRFLSSSSTANALNMDLYARWFTSIHEHQCNSFTLQGVLLEKHTNYWNAYPRPAVFDGKSVSFRHMRLKCGLWHCDILSAVNRLKDGGSELLTSAFISPPHPCPVCLESAWVGFVFWFLSQTVTFCIYSLGSRTDRFIHGTSDTRMWRKKNHS